MEIEGPGQTTSKPGLWRRLSRNRVAVLGAVWLLLVVAMALLLPLFYRVSYEEVEVTARLARPGLAHPLGTDESGRDVLARLIYGARLSLVVGTVAAAVAIFLGTAAGALSGHFGGRVDSVLQRLTDTFMSVPIFFFLLMLLALFGSSLPILILGIGVTSWMGVSRIVRSEILRHRGMEFVTAARALGASEGRVLWHHLLPPAVPSIIVAATLAIAHGILAETSLSYLGLGVQPPLPSWGNMLTGAQSYLWTAPQLAVYPGLLIMGTVLALNMLGDGLRDALDPEMVGQPAG